MNPMLAATVKDVTTLRFPLLASPKLDGIRAVVQDGVVLGRSLKPLPNKLIQQLLGRPELNGLDGELVVGHPTDPLVYNRTQRGVMAVETAPSFNFWVFDCQDSALPFQARLARSQQLARDHDRQRLIVPVPHKTLNSVKDLDAYEAEVLQLGYEGVMLRTPTGRYKAGRSTLSEAGLMKLKRFDDAEAEVIGATELMQNTNAAKPNELGHMTRSSHQAGMVGRGCLGALVVQGLNGPYAGVTFHIGTGFDEALRYELWLLYTIGKLNDKVVKYKYFFSGAKDAPRFPVFTGFRLKEDQS